MSYRTALFGASILMSAAPVFAGPTPPSYVPDLLPPNPVAGECYGRVEIPAQYETVTEQVVTRDTYQRLLVQHPQLENATERVMVKEPSVRFVVQQPTYGTVTQQVLTRPGYDKLTVSEPQFRTVTETLKKGQSRLVWKRGNPAKLRAQGYTIHSTARGQVNGRGYQSIQFDSPTGGQACGTVCEVWCLVEEPGETVTVTRQALSRPGQVHRTSVPPAYQTVTKQVVTNPGGVKKIPVPAEYRDLTVQKLVRPGGVATINVPAEKGHAQGRRLVSEARYEWRRIACKPPAHTVTTHQSQARHGYSNHGYSKAQTQTYAPARQHHHTMSHVAPRPTPVTQHTLASSQSGITRVRPYVSPASTVTHSAPLNGTLSHTRPAYVTGYDSSVVTGHSTQSHQPVVIKPSEGFPERSYSGPAYSSSAAASSGYYENR